MNTVDVAADWQMMAQGGAEGIDPADALSVSSDLVMLSDPEGATAETIRQLRTRLTVQHLDRGRRTLAFCTPGAGSGCSFIVANLAVAFAQVGVRVVLVNADMRQPGLDDFFGEAGRGPGLMQYLSDQDSGLGGVTLYEILPSLNLLPSGGPAANAQELLSKPRFSMFIDQCLREFDLTLIDSPPAGLYSDAQRIATIAGFAAIVARADKTYFGDVSQLSRQLTDDRVSVVGTVLNDY